MKYSLIIICLIVTSLGQAQEVNLDINAIFQKVQDTYKKNNAYSFYVTYELFKDSTSTKVEESYSGRIIKNANNFYSKIHNTEFIQLDGNYIKINHDEQAMVYGKGMSETDLKSITDISNFIKYFESNNIKQDGDIIICELTSNKVTILPYSKVMLYINKDFTLKKQVMYMLQPTAFKDINGKKSYSNPRMELNISNLSISNAVPSTIFKTSTYITNAQGKVKPSNNLKNYQLIDITKN